MKIIYSSSFIFSVILLIILTNVEMIFGIVLALLGFCYGAFYVKNFYMEKN